MSSFDLFFTVIIPATLILIMVGMGMSLTPSSFAVLARRPKPVLLGLLGQMLLLPLIALAILSLVTVPDHVALGLLLLSACPGGVTSNAVSFAAKADVALSVGLTAMNSLLIVVTMPLILGLAPSLLSLQELAAFSLPVGLLIKQLMMLCVVPVAVGMLVRGYFPAFAIGMEGKMRIAAAVAMAFVLTGYLVSERALLLQNLTSMGVLVIGFMLTVMAAGWLLGTLGRLGRQQRTTIIIEVGLQNTSVAVFVATVVLENQAIGMLPATYGALMMFVVGAFALVNAKLGKKVAGAQVSA
ncbi:hypothetical protein NCG89_15000 [Spongiibacter taiwanensis]|uniref:bile acid:sodium symporter family protein n=1 Tax=Spongiibacter taiwanensis TaxID=1748242 RepID=UPI0020356C59|nr:hypothetical protein [Spongiibacter taiwanensis]USA42839.1 hypothetical protein NCG89_15000 [Spongiibacter taiwanensis]